MRQHTAVAAAQHFIPRQRDPARHAELAAHLVELWGQAHVEVQSCAACGFGFAVPMVGGDARFYTLTEAGDPHYPADRWEFGETLRVLGTPGFEHPLRILEVGAGDGAFLDRLRRELTSGHDLLAAEFDAGAVQRLQAKGYEALLGSIADVAAAAPAPFDVVCMFQTLEHMADIDTVFALLRDVLRPTGSVFLSVPNSEATAFQEAKTGLWDMPPNHVGRWNPPALRAASELRRFEVIDIREQPVSIRSVAQQLAVSAVNARSYTDRTIESRVNGIASRPTRGALKRLVALRYVPGLLRARAEFRPWTFWAHMRPSA